MVSEAVKVIVRCRPLNERELNMNCQTVVQIINESGQCSLMNMCDSKAPVKNFFFDGAYDQDSCTENIYNDIGYPLVEGVTEGFNCTIFAYGQTGCGKSYTMQGLNDSATQRGVIPRSFEHIFETISLCQSTKFLIHVSFLEIYNEEIRDLLVREVKGKLDVKEHPDRGVYVAGLSMHKVSAVHECQVIMNMGWKNRSTGSTLMNADSSRSHSIFTIYVEMADRDSTLNEERIRAGKLNLVDLAGSERQSKTGASGERFKEATKINLSLSALGNVISALVDSKVKHIPYRDSKLTRLLQDSLGGNTKTLMIACLSPADNNYDETLSTLRYANRAKDIQNKPKINEDPKDALLRQYQEEIMKLRQLLDGQPTVIHASLTEKHTSEELDVLKQEYETRLREKETLYSIEAAEKTKLLSELQHLREFYKGHHDEFDGTTSLSLSGHRRACEAVCVGVDTPNIYSADDLNSLSITHSTKDAPNPVIILDPDGRPRSLWEQNDEVHPITTSTTSATTATPKLADIPLPLNKPGGIRSGACFRTFDDRNKTKPNLASLSRDDLLNRITLLETGLVGGEEVGNCELKARRSRRQRCCEERRRRLEEANAMLEDDGIMIGIYENIQDELSHMNKLLQKEKQKNTTLNSELGDIQSEFEQDRCDYLDTIRRQQRHSDLLQAIIDRMQPCMRRDSNYHNVDKIKRLAKYDEDHGEWILPHVSIERTQLPHNIPDTPSHLRSAINDSLDLVLGNASQAASWNGLRHDPIGRDFDMENEDEARFYAKLSNRTQSQPNYFANRRANQLLIDAAALGSGVNRSTLVNTTNANHTAVLNRADSNPIFNSNLMDNLPGALDSVPNGKKRHNKIGSNLIGKQNSPQGKHRG